MTQTAEVAGTPRGRIASYSYRERAMVSHTITIHKFPDSRPWINNCLEQSSERVFQFYE